MQTTVIQRQERPAAPRRPEARGAPPRRRLSAGRLLVAALLIGLMAIGSVVMWLVVPAAWLWFASQLQKGASPTLGPYVLVLAGIPISMFAIGKLLARLDRGHAAVTHRHRGGRVHQPWHKSMRGERGSGRERTVLDTVMVVSVSLALVAFGVWFFAFAGSSLPT